MKNIKKKILLAFPIVGLVVVLLLTNSCSNELDLLFPEWENAPATTPLIQIREREWKVFIV